MTDKELNKLVDKIVSTYEVNIDDLKKKFSDGHTVFEEVVIRSPKYINKFKKSDLIKILDLKNLSKKFLKTININDEPILFDLIYDDVLDDIYITPELMRLQSIDDFPAAMVYLYSKENIDKDTIDKFMDPSILRIVDHEGGEWSVAHELASKGYLSGKEDSIPEDILLIKDSKNNPVFKYTEKYGKLNTLDDVKNAKGLYLLAMSKYKYPKTSFEKFKHLTDRYGLDKMKQMVKLTGERNG